MNYLLSGIIDQTHRVPIKWGEGRVLEDLLNKGYKIIEKDYTTIKKLTGCQECEIYILQEPKKKELYELMICFEDLD